MNTQESRDKQKLPIAIFDSGIGGLTVLREARRELPNENYIYFADTDHVPYGVRDKEDVRNLVLKAAQFLNEQNIKMLVVACNTATSSAIVDLRSIYKFPIVGMEPAVKLAISNTKNKRILVLATELTLREKKFRDLVDAVDNEGIVDILPLPELVTFAEQFVFDDEIIIPELMKKLEGLNPEDYETVVLGCTHFPFYRDALSKIFPSDTSIIGGNRGTVNRIKNILQKEDLVNPATKNGNVIFYHSGRRVTDLKLIAKYEELIAG